MAKAFLGLKKLPGFQSKTLKGSGGVREMGGFFGSGALPLFL
ncbi:hypothetical protein [Okeania sp. SIO2C9]|nr:hypothetical protein [Okeania sp. SIO2C9]